MKPSGLVLFVFSSAVAHEPYAQALAEACSAWTHEEQETVNLLQVDLAPEKFSLQAHVGAQQQGGLAGKNANPSNVLNYPNHSSGAMPTPSFYFVINNGILFGNPDQGEMVTGADAHCVHVAAVTCPAASQKDCFLCVGKMVEVSNQLTGALTSPEFKDGLVVMVSDSSLKSEPSKALWHKTFGVSKQQDGANCALEIGTGISKGLYVAGFGYNSLTKSVDRTLLKYHSNGTLAWQIFLDPDAPSSGLSSSSRVVGGFEWIGPSVGGGVVLGGFVKARLDMPLDFKSYGNVDDCTATITVIDGELLASGKLVLQDTLDVELSKAFSVKKVLQITAGDDEEKFVAVSGGDPQQMPTITMLSSELQVEWQITVPIQAEATDLAVDSSGSYFIMSGHVDYLVQPVGFKTYDARFTRVENKDYHKMANYTSGMVVQPTWQSTFGDNASIIFDECWGLQFLPDAAPGGLGDSVVVACASGVEPGTCSKVAWASIPAAGSAGSKWIGPSTAAECTAIGEKWKNLNMRIRAQDGALIWMRTDDFLQPDSRLQGEKPAGSATEYSVLTRDGGLLGVTDESDGIGFLKFSTQR